MAEAQRITITREDVLTALETRPVALRTVADVALAVITHVYDVKNVYGGKEAMWRVNQADLRRLLADMVSTGALVMRTGDEWVEHGAPSWLGRPNGHYYVLPAQAESWDEDAAKKRAEAQEQEADRYARELLVIRHPEEYAELMEAYRGGARLVE